MKTLVCFGDSITADETFFDGTPRLTSRLQAMFPNWKVVNAGVPGDNTFDALNRIEEDVISYKPDFVTVFLGTNDAVSFSQVSLQAYKENLEKIVNQVSSDKILLISPAPVDEERQYNRTNKVLGQYTDVVEEVARETGSYFLNVYAEMIQERDYKRFVENDEKDGLHFGPEGYEYVAKLIGEKLKGIL
ncbi:esterase [Bacillus thuringiensis]|uniref:Esterase n=1 Tax=Bacillus cereus TaxID=1396 RepID=A0AAN5XMS7_BACCE|nr:MULTISPECIES: SGNH/GDSL hydrolase family protein [Bacillus]KAB2369376.1 esterase [Bacillus thuringiensis]KAB2447291.1 esterase [Bacillus cereus]KAB2487000.1 esterase [Bacillus cereus]MCP1393911.1 lysophospholipase L1-like esterase [Bacillus cereus]MCU4954895.1 SGNH/GDSL hydrolase family protein [Bacillus cereus]